MSDILQISFQVNCSQEHAFRTWTERATAWWPMDHTPTGDQASTFVFDGKAGGQIYERTPRDERNVMGTILDWDPFSRIRHSWLMGAPKGKATEVEIRFSEQVNGTTTVSIEQSGWAVFGSSADQARDGNQRGWGELITYYIPAAEPQPHEPKEHTNE